MKYDRAFELVVGAEGVYSSDPNDNGNWTGGRRGFGELMGTKYGIAANTYGKALKAAGKTIKDLTLEDAKEIYKRDYWNVLRCDELPEIYRYALFSCGVNCGVRRAAKLFQSVLGVIVDGIIGGATIRAARSCRDQEGMFEDFLLAWADYYDSVVQKNPTLAAYRRGWQNRINEVKKESLKS